MDDRALSRHWLAGGCGALVLMLAASVWWAQRTLGEGFLPHGYCLTWIPGLLWLHVASDSLIALAYFSIPLSLLHIVRRRGDVPFSWMFLLFGSFIVACGLTHAFDVWTLWHADYWLSGGVKAVTAAVSVTTAVALLGAMPRMLAIPSAEQLRRAKETLEQEVQARRQAEAELRQMRDALAQRVAQRTADLADAHALLDATFDAAPLGLAVFDEADRFVRVNPALAQISAAPAENYLGRNLRDMLPQLGESLTPYLRTTRETRAPVIGIELSGGAMSGAPVHFRISCFPVASEGRPALVGVVCEDISFRRTAEAERARLLHEAQEANRMKDEFMARVSHELRTPLQAIMSWMALLKSQRLDADGAARALDRVDHNVRLQARMISDLLDTARILSGKLNIEVATVDPAQTLQRVMDNMATAAADKSLTLHVDLLPGRGQLLTDAQRLEQVANNLVGNAVKYTLAGGNVWVNTEWNEEAWVLVVRDDGIGLDAQELGQVFQPFRRGSDLATQQQQGLGLGLAIARNLAELMGGSIEAHSDGVGRGARFILRLPRQAPILPHRAGNDDAQANIDLHGVQVLYVEDESDVAEATAQALRGFGASVSVALSSDAALALLGNMPFDVVVCDLRLAHGDSGFIVQRALRERFAHLPALALSAFGSPTDLEATQAAGFASHLVKPVAPAMLAAAIAASLAR
jgi:PAS domain S-box-containing protein